jgi:hypothetical protein
MAVLLLLDAFVLLSLCVAKSFMLLFSYSNEREYINKLSFARRFLCRGGCSCEKLCFGIGRAGKWIDLKAKRHNVRHFMGSFTLYFRRLLGFVMAVDVINFPPRRERLRINS